MLFSKKIKEIVSGPEPIDIPQWFEQHNAHYTHDINELEAKPWHPTFVYSKQEEDILTATAATRYCGVAYTEDYFRMWWQKDKAIPVICNDGTMDGAHIVPWMQPKGAEQAQIRGKLLSVKAPRIIELDKLKRNGVEFVRELVWVKVPHTIEFETLRDGKKRTELIHTPVKCWMYIAKDKFWRPKLDADSAYDRAFEPVKIFISKNSTIKRYYLFRPNNGNPI